MEIKANSDEDRNGIGRDRKEEMKRREKNREREK